ncbi:MAG: M16 family metallopeptidase [Candidatus Berkiellales bacterium]
MDIKILAKKQYRLWLLLFIGLLVIATILMINKESHAPLPTPRGELVKMIGTKGKSPESLASYKTVTGILNIQHWVTDQGVRVYFVPVTTFPMVDIQITFDAGAARDGNKGGMAYLTNLLLADGTKEISPDQVALSFENVGAQYHSQSLRDMSIINLRSLSSASELTTALKTLSAIISQPAFSEGGFKREQQNMLSTLQQEGQMPQKVASRAFFTELYGKGPYANWQLGDEASVKALTINDVKEFHQKYYVTKNMVVTVVGNLTADDANALVQALSEHLPVGEKAPLLPKVADLTEKQIKKISFPSQQTHILLGEPVLSQGDPDYYPLTVGNHILGGNGSVTQLYNIVRSQHGLAYSIDSYFLPFRDKGPFVISCQTRNDKAEEALKLLEGTFTDFVAKGPTEDELAQAKQNLLGGYALQFDSNVAISQQVALLGFYDLPLTFFNDFKPAVEKLTVEDIKKAYQKRVSPNHYAIVMVGGKATPGGPLEDIKTPHHDVHSGPGGSQS